MSLGARDTKERINKWDFIKIKSFCTAKKKNQQNEKGIYHMGKYTKDTLDKDLISKIHKELI